LRDDKASARRLKAALREIVKHQPNPKGNGHVSANP
jgi:hypothetical protein